jgi:Xaa-Pro dipeptidase
MRIAYTLLERDESSGRLLTIMTGFFPESAITDLTESDPDAPEFAPDEYTGRLDTVRAALSGTGCSAGLLTSPESIYYCTGLNHQGHFAFTALVLPVDGDPVLVAREMERPTVEAQATACLFFGYTDSDDPALAVFRVLAQVGRSATVGVELGSMSFPPRLWHRITDSLPEVTWIDISETVSEVRAVKSPAELAQVRRAARLSDKAMRTGIAAAGEGVRPSTMAADVYRAMIAGGSGYPGFAPLIRSADRVLYEHVTWNHRPLHDGDAVFLELSAVCARYHAPLTRMVHVGRAPDGVEYSAELAVAGLEAVRAALRPGVVASEVYATWQRVIDDGLGHKDYRRHHCGYTVGIGFPPSWTGGGSVIGLRGDSDLEISAGMTFHVLSWILGQQIPDYAVSDTVLVTDNGGELLTHTDHGPTIV